MGFMAETFLDDLSTIGDPNGVPRLAYVEFGDA